MWMVERKQKGIEPPQVLSSNMVPPSLQGIVSGVDLQTQVVSCENIAVYLRLIQWHS